MPKYETSWISLLEIIEEVAKREFSGDEKGAWKNVLSALRDGAIRSRGCYRREHYSSTQFMQVDIPPAAWGPGRYDKVADLLSAPRELYWMPRSDGEEIINLHTVELSSEHVEKIYGESFSNKKCSEPATTHTGFPGRSPKLKHLIEREFRRRIDSSEICDTLADEARKLRNWAIENYPEAPPPTEKTIKNNIRADFRSARCGPKIK